MTTPYSESMSSRLGGKQLRWAKAGKESSLFDVVLNHFVLRCHISSAVGIPSGESTHFSEDTSASGTRTTNSSNLRLTYYIGRTYALFWKLFFIAIVFQFWAWIGSFVDFLIHVLSSSRTDLELPVLWTLQTVCQILVLIALLRSKNNTVLRARKSQHNNNISNKHFPCGQKYGQCICWTTAIIQDPLIIKTCFNYCSSGSGQNSIIPVVCNVPE